MSTSTDGIVFYGFSIDDDHQDYSRCEAFEDDGDDLPSDEHCEIGIHCSLDYPHYYVAIKKSVVLAGRGDPKTFATDVGAEWADKLREFCTANKLTYQQPAWMVASLWA